MVEVELMSTSKIFSDLILRETGLRLLGILVVLMIFRLRLRLQKSIVFQPKSTTVTEINKS
jgi:hypothetical protein